MALLTRMTSSLMINKVTFFAVIVIVIVTNNVTNCNAFQLRMPSSSMINRPSLLSLKFQRSTTNTAVGSSVVITGSTVARSTTSSTSLFATPTPTPTPTPIIKTNDDLKDPRTLISSQDAQTQQIAFVSICIGILGGSFLFLEVYNYLELLLPAWAFNPFYNVLPYILSSAFIAAGISHFALEDTFTSFVPPKGSWGGLFIVPAPFSEQLNLTYAQYHSFWTGLAEILVGTSLILTTSGVLGEQFNNPTIPSFLMYLLTLIVTPANIYMYTHNPVVPRIPPLPYPYGHVGRGVLQMALLAVFFKLTIHSM
ncbi:hypothetical protein FRACYDRAFT_220108 [Fragilariopsis cylindrus CCMP1102]|uniref:Uncharacterized protein n=1 Tax=Fragilariopsis cylindrus CCMP1102 TaxID=635003 RepID=A0A1E7EZE2_9STRA|nr:hypothetical protein FRACYDRAFT_220108 [Fragilariopsis cylindrus CCMP1102]|eukprot:OEU10913.1 hypothetical protein FRACYDRAFT_220108 [Fragilariopsis cylindrus CCMP1102]